jgi:hypothetical protein
MTSAKTVSVNAEELRTTFEFVNFGTPLEHSAYICVDTGKNTVTHSRLAGGRRGPPRRPRDFRPLHCRATQERPGPRPASRASLRRSRIVRRIRYRCRFFWAERGGRTVQGIVACAWHAGTMVCIRKPCDGKGPPRLVRRERHPAC